MANDSRPGDGETLPHASGASAQIPPSFRSGLTPGAGVVDTASLGEGGDGGTYYDAHPIAQMHSPLAMLAYDMNGEPLSFGHGAPLRLRNEIELGFKQVKWIRGIELVADFSDVGSGFGGYNQDHEFFGYSQSL